jgi:hypothetical protein
MGSGLSLVESRIGRELRSVVQGARRGEGCRKVVDQGFA